MSEEQRPLLLALHGWGARGVFFDDLALRLTDQCDVIAPDLAGHGNCKAGDQVSLESQANQINALLKPYRGRKIILLGWSMGAAAAFAYLDQFGPDKITGMIVEDMGPKPLNTEDWNIGIGNGYSAKDIQETINRIRAGWQIYGKRVWRATFANPSVARQFETHPLFEFFLDNREEPMEQAWQSLMDLDARSMLARLDLPVLAITGAQSHVYDARLADWYRDHLPNGDVMQIEGAGHAPHLEQPEIFAEAVVAFMKKHC